MKFKNTYKVLSKHIFANGDYSLIPIRAEDRFDIMKWRNEQMYHLRQEELLTTENQNSYFESTVASLFDDERPSQILFSFLHKKQCIGYGGLVHINWLDKNAEISFVMDTSKEKDSFEDLWVCYLNLIEEVAFMSLHLNKIYTYAYDLRPRLYTALHTAGFEKEAVLKNHKFIDCFYADVLIHSKLNKANEEPTLDRAGLVNAHKYFEWVNNEEVRVNSFNTDKITWENHLSWYKKMLSSSDCELFVLKLNGNVVGQLRLNKVDESWVIDYSIDASYRRMSLAYKMITSFIKKNPERKLVAKVKTSNIPSIRVFEKLNFKKRSLENTFVEFYRNQ